MRFCQQGPLGQLVGQFMIPAGSIIEQDKDGFYVSQGGVDHVSGPHTGFRYPPSWVPGKSQTAMDQEAYDYLRRFLPDTEVSADRSVKRYQP